MNRLSKSLAATACAGALLTAMTSPAASAPRPWVDQEYTFELSGQQDHAWRVRSSIPLDDLAGWTSADGTQSITWKTKRRGKLRITHWKRRQFGDVRMPQYTLEGTTREATLDGSVERVSVVQRRAPTPVCEGGTLDPECLVVPLTVDVPQQCGRRTAVFTSTLQLSSDERGLTMPLTAEYDAYEACGPTSGNGSSFVRSFQEPMAVTFPGAVRRIGRLARGRTLRLTAQLTSDGCGAPPGQTGFVACAKTDVTVRLRRTR